MYLSHKQKLAIGIGAAIAATAATAGYAYNKRPIELPTSYQQGTQAISDNLQSHEQSLSVLVPEGSANTVVDPQFMRIMVG